MPLTGSNRRLRDRGGIQLPSASSPQDERNPAAARRVITGRSGWRPSSSLSVGTQEAEGRTRKPNRRGIHDHATGDRLRGVSIDQAKGTSCGVVSSSCQVQKAIVFASTAHIGQFRRTGDPYVTHCIHTGKILAALVGPNHWRKSNRYSCCWHSS